MVRASQATTVSMSSPDPRSQPERRSDGAHETPPTSPTESEDETSDGVAGPGWSSHGDGKVDKPINYDETESQLLPPSLMDSWLPMPPEDSSSNIPESL
jgi:hypothetical protein